MTWKAPSPDNSLQKGNLSEAGDLDLSAPVPVVASNWTIVSEQVDPALSFGKGERIAQGNADYLPSQKSNTKLNRAAKKGT
jgi:hypothetical protein